MVDKKLINIEGSFKLALEHAKFDDPDVREYFMKAIKALDADLEEVNYEPSVITIEIFEQLDEALRDSDEPEVKMLTAVDANGNGDELTTEEELDEFIQDSADEAEVEEVEFDDDDEA